MCVCLRAKKHAQAPRVRVLWQQHNTQRTHIYYVRLRSSRTANNPAPLSPLELRNSSSGSDDRAVAKRGCYERWRLQLANYVRFRAFMIL